MNEDAIKVARLEVQMANIEAKVDAGFLEVKQVIQQLSSKVDSIGNLQNEINNLNTEINNMKIEREAERKMQSRKNLLIGFVYPTLAAIASAILTLLLVFYITNIGKVN